MGRGCALLPCRPFLPFPFFQCVILVEQFYGTFVSPRPDLIIAAYGSYLIMPLLLLIRALPSRMFDTGVRKITETGAETKKSK